MMSGNNNDSEGHLREKCDNCRELGKKIATTTGKMFQHLVLMSLLCFSWATAGLPCPQPFPSQQPPLTADRVRPSDVAVLSYIGLNEQSTELSSVLSRLTELMTFFNPSLMTTTLHEQGIPLFPQHITLVEQANEVSLYLQSNRQDTTGNRDWKLVLLFVQVDQLCVCGHQEEISSLIERVVKEVDDAVQLLHSQLRRTIVGVTLWDGGLNAFQEKTCPCIHTYTDGELRLQRAILTHTLQESLAKLMAQKHWYRDRHDFTVTLHETPLIKGLSSTGKPYGESEAFKQTDELMLQLWNNLLQPKVDQEHNKNIIKLQCPTVDRPFLRTEVNAPSSHYSNADYFIQTRTGTEMPCKDFSPSSSIPTSVNELRPADIKVVAAVGDSLTAGNGVGSSPDNLLDVIRQYRGLSWSIGGDENLTTVTTLPNLLKHFNQNVTGYSLGVGGQNGPQAFLNQAVPGAKSRNIPSQVRALIKRMKNDTNINFETDWKVITIFIGGNDLCAYCENTLLYSVENYTQFLQESLDYLHKEVPRALVNLVEPLYILPLREMHMDSSLNCPTWLLNTLCPCVVLPESNSEALTVLGNINRGYQRLLHELVESGRYDTHPDFTVVIQPFLRDITIPKLPDGRPDRSFFSPDCFHLSQKAHTMMARSLWNNMLEPLGAKTSNHDFTSAFDLKCPTHDSPFIFTKGNSPAVPPVTTSKPTPSTTTTVSATISPKCSSSIPVWVPVVVGIGSLLAGIIICWLIMFFIQRKKN